MTYSWSALGPTTSSRPIPPPPPPPPYMSRISAAASVTQSDLGSFILLFLFMSGFCLACQQGDTAHYYSSLYLPQPSCLGVVWLYEVNRLLHLEKCLFLHYDF